MTNPVSLNPAAQLPPPGTPIVDPATGIATPQYHRFEAALVQRTGGSGGASIGEVEITATTALNEANAASAEATLANSKATQALTAADTAQTAAVAAQSTATAAQSVASRALTGSLQRASNLSDVTSISVARVNLGVNVIPICFEFDTLPSGLTRYRPLLFGITIPADLAGTLTYCGIVPAANATFTVEYIRNGTVNVIGTLTLVAGSVIYFPSVQGAINLLANDVLAMKCPSPADATLAQVGITLYATMT